MKTRYPLLLAILALVALLLTPKLLRAQDDPNDDQGASFQTFYDQLGDQGTWIQTDDYGYVFQPAVTDPNWAPYTVGHWVYTDVGWTWVSDEPWGWATYHYGRWINIDGTGWVWVPGYRWAPAWVSWRYGGGYAGWAPLPPETFVGVEYGDLGDGGGAFHFGGDVDISFHIGAGEYNFVHVSDMGESNYRPYYVNRYNNYEIINRTTNITNINVSGGAARGRSDFRAVAIGGPSIGEVNAHARERIPTVTLSAANQPGRSTLQGNNLAIFAPRVNPASVHQARPATIARTVNHPTFNRGDSIMKPLAVTASVKPKPPSDLAIAAARQAAAHIPPNAKIAMPATPIRNTPVRPLTTQEPANQTYRPAQASPGAGGTNPYLQHPAATPSASTEFTQPHTTQPEQPKPQTVYHPQFTPASTQQPAEHQPQFEPQHQQPAEHQPQFVPQHQQPAEHQPQAPMVHSAPAPAQHPPQAPAAQPQARTSAPGAPDDKKKAPVPGQ